MLTCNNTHTSFYNFLVMNRIDFDQMSKEQAMEVIWDLFKGENIDLRAKLATINIPSPDVIKDEVNKVWTDQITEIVDWIDEDDPADKICKGAIRNQIAELIDKEAVR